MAGRGVWGKRLLGGLLLILVLGCGVVAWRERATLMSWYYVRALARATDKDRERWAERVAKLGETAIPGVFGCLAQPDTRMCVNARAALEHLTHSWGGDDPCTAELALRLARGFSRFSPAGQRQVLELAAGWFDKPGGDSLISACSHLLAEAAATTDAGVQASALELCGLLLSQPHEKEAQSGKSLHAARELVRVALHAGDVETRLRAIRLSLHPGMVDVLEQVAALLNDESPQVRRAALLAVGPARDVVHDDLLLPSLHDPDPEVRRLCETALGSRGLRPEYLELGRLLTDPQPVKRLQVLDRLRESTELDPGLWLRRLSHDPSPSVRVAAMRAMTQQSFVDLSDRIDQMARTDPSPTVCQLAQFYLNCPRPAPASSPPTRKPHPPREP